MEATLTRVFACALFLLILLSNTASSENISLALVSFLKNLSPGNPNIDRDLGWNASSDPCRDLWRGVSCNNAAGSIRVLLLESLGLDGSIDGDSMSLLCNSTSLSVFSLQNNSISGELPPTIGGCTVLTHIYLDNNRLSGSLPSTIANLKNLKRLDISNNNFSGDLPSNLSTISGLLTFLASNNNFTGAIPGFDLNYFTQFNVSFNKFSGPLPANSAKFPLSSFTGNPGLCGEPLLAACPSLPPPSPTPSGPKSKKSSSHKIVMIFGYVLVGLAIVVFLVYKLLSKKQKKKIDTPPYGEMDNNKTSESSGKFGNASRSEYSISSAPHSITGASTSLVVLNQDRNKVLKFDDLLRAPAELIGKGRFGSLYKVMIEGGVELAVKRIKDGTVSGEEFQKKIMKMDQARHPNVLSVAAFYCSKQEKLVVYEYQKNGSLFKLLHDNKEGREFNWASRLQVAAGVSAGLAFMHQCLGSDVGGSGHGNLKSSNILFSSSMDALVSEYGVTALPTHPVGPKVADAAEQFSPAADVYAFGVVVLELLTGKPSHGFDLAEWVHSVVREEWTGEVFDRSLLTGEGEEAEEGMVRLLQLALQCMGDQPEKRLNMAQVAVAVAGILEVVERKVNVEE